MGLSVIQFLVIMARIKERSLQSCCSVMYIKQPNVRSTCACPINGERVRNLFVLRSVVHMSRSKVIFKDHWRRKNRFRDEKRMTRREKLILLVGNAELLSAESSVDGWCSDIDLVSFFWRVDEECGCV